MAPSFHIRSLLFQLLGILTLVSFACAAISTKANILIIARDEATSKSAYSGLQGYGIPYRALIVPKEGVALPQLNSSATSGNFGGIVIVSDVSYDYGTATNPFRSALTDAQWAQLYAYQTTFHVRMVRIDVYPGPQFGVGPALNGTGCCSPPATQLVSLSNTTGFRTASLKTGAGLATDGLWHVPAAITDPATTWEFAQFTPGGSYPSPTTAGVINKFADGREQMVFFIGWATDWSSTSTFLQHAWVHYMTRGLYAGFRRTYLSTQIDDVFLVTDLYEPAGSTFRVRPADIDPHITWMKDINSRLPKGSNFMVELGHNGNGDIEAGTALATSNQCVPNEAIYYPEQIDTVLEFMKPPGTGTNIWPATPLKYGWTTPCEDLDPLMKYFRTTSKRDAFMHMSHTFTHAALNNATYSDVAKEIQFNTAWLRNAGFAAAKHFSPAGLIPPAITGMHNVDAIKAWMDNGIKYVVGDNTRPVLTNTQNPYWPLISTVASNGYAGLVIMPRWATTIYYNCDLPACTLHEWINTSAGSGDFTSLLNNARTTNTWHLLGLHWDPFMFHQANLRQADVPQVNVNGKMVQMSLVQIWTEVITQELVRLTDWPIITKKHDDLALAFLDRMHRDQCSPSLTWNYSDDGKSIFSVTVGAGTSNSCNAPIPVTVPGNVGSIPSGATREQVGSDPLTIWVKLTGTAQTIPLNPVLSVV